MCECLVGLFSVIGNYDAIAIGREVPWRRGESALIVIAGKDVPCINCLGIEYGDPRCGGRIGAK